MRRIGRPLEIDYGLRAGSVEAEGGARDACVRHGHERIAGNGGLAGVERLHDCSDGSDRSVLEAGVACARRSF